jgi:membrane protein required for colicin V production
MKPYFYPYILTMNYLDIIIALPLLLGLFKGFKRGFVIEAASLVGLLLATYGGIKLSGYVANILVEKYEFETQFLPVFSFVIVFVGIVILIHLLARVLQGFLQLAMLGTVNRIFGSVFCCLKYAVIVSVMLFLLNFFNDDEWLLTKEKKAGSVLYQPLSQISVTLVPALKEQVMLLKEKYEDLEIPESVKY